MRDLPDVPGEGESPGVEAPKGIPSVPGLPDVPDSEDEPGWSEGEHDAPQARQGTSGHGDDWSDTSDSSHHSDSADDPDSSDWPDSDWSGSSDRSRSPDFSDSSDSSDWSDSSDGYEPHPSDSDSHSGGHDSDGDDWGSDDSGGHDSDGHSGGHDSGGHDSDGDDSGGHDSGGGDSGGHDEPADPDRSHEQPCENAALQESSSRRRGDRFNLVAAPAGDPPGESRTAPWPGSSGSTVHNGWSDGRFSASWRSTVAERPFNIRSARVLEQSYGESGSNMHPLLTQARSDSSRLTNRAYRGVHRAELGMQTEDRNAAWERSTRVGRHHAEPVDDHYINRR